MYNQFNEIDMIASSYNCILNGEYAYMHMHRNYHMSKLKNKIFVRTVRIFYKKQEL